MKNPAPRIFRLLLTIAVAVSVSHWPGTICAEEASPAASASPSPAAAATVTPTPATTPSPAATLSPAPTPSSAKSIRISFLPPPLEGTISLGIYDEWNNLVRVLHQEAELDEFVVGDDALSTKWDGRDDDGYDVFPGHYQARGFVVGKLRNEVVTPSPSAALIANGPVTITIKLMPNPLGGGERSSVALAVGFDDENSYLKTADGLPLYTISNKTNVQRAGITKTGERSAEIWQDDGLGTQQFKVSNLDRMMSFDCGDFEVK